MLATYRLPADKLDEEFLSGLKSTFRGKEVAITVCEVDETEHLLASSANRERLLEAVRDINAGRGLVTADAALFRRGSSSFTPAPGRTSTTGSARTPGCLTAFAG
jgi:antitoxin YefM